ncbi:hypothetical protein ACMD2_25927, partial [Ananas comosus]
HTQPQVSLSSHQSNATSHISVDDVDQLVDTEVEICVEDSSGSRKTRGVTRMSDVWNLPPEMCIFVKFNSFYQPVDTEGSVLHQLMGTIVRKPNLLPIDCFNWHKMDAKYKEYCWKILEERSRKNRHNRDQQMDFYAAGSKSIAQYAYNMEKNGVVPTRGKLYVVHHKKKNGEPVTKLAKNRIEKLEPLIQKEVDVSQTGSSGGSLMWAAIDAYAEVIGKERHAVSWCRFGPTPSMFGASAINTSQRLRMVPKEEILRDKEEIRDLRDRLKFIEENVAFLLSQQSKNSRDGKGASTLEQQRVQATEAAQPLKRRRHPSNIAGLE